MRSSRHKYDCAVFLEFVSAQEASDMFISYSSEATEVVDSLLEVLPREEPRLSIDDELPPPFPFTCRVFRDVESIRSGEMWDRALTEAIFKTRTLLPVLSRAYCSSPLCMFELILFLNRLLIEQIVFNPGRAPGARYLGRDDIVIPFRAERCTIPSVIQRIHAPLIPVERPIPARFAESVRQAIIEAITATGIGMSRGASGELRVGITAEHDRIGLNTPRKAAARVLSLCQRLLNEKSLSRSCRDAVMEVSERTMAYLVSSGGGEGSTLLDVGDSR